MATILAPATDALDVLFGQCPRTFNWVAGFTYRGRAYTMRQSGCTTFSADHADVPVFNAAGRATMLRVHAAGEVIVTSRYLVGGGTAPEVTD